MIKSYKQIIVFLVKSAKKNADSKGINFNEEKSIKMHEAVLYFSPVDQFYCTCHYNGGNISVHTCFSHH